jgi:hypothetical protein
MEGIVREVFEDMVLGVLNSKTNGSFWQREERGLNWT